ncbi:hypothetical protein PWR63_21775 [Paraburkholderia sp. A2WS-5]|uniref:hypothetical protein n=1 Tax=unclassified Paraburkholderia TaxID=2615204 RepID=UPI003B827EB4
MPPPKNTPVRPREQRDRIAAFMVLRVYQAVNREELFRRLAARIALGNGVQPCFAAQPRMKKGPVNALDNAGRGKRQCGARARNQGRAEPAAFGRCVGEALSMAKSLYWTGSAGFLEVLVAERAQFAAQDPLKLTHMIRKGQLHDERGIKTAAEPN